MKKYLSLAGLILCTALILGVSSGHVYARLTGTEPGTDQWCMGISGAEVCVDASGNLIPTTDNDTTLGTSALRFATAYIMDITVGDDLTVTGNLAVTSASTFAAASTYTGTGGMVIVSTAATSGVTMCLAGSFQTLPTTGYSKGCIAYQISDNTPYISTETVVIAQSWKALY